LTEYYIIGERFREDKIATGYFDLTQERCRSQISSSAKERVKGGNEMFPPKKATQPLNQSFD
jgi:hypothetical protein